MTDTDGFIFDSLEDPFVASFNLELSSTSFLLGCYAVLLAYSLVQISKLWLAGSKISNRKRVFFSIISLLVVRFSWLFLGHLGLSHALLPSPLPALLLRLLYLLPLALVFRSSSWLLLNWFELYQKEKLRKKLPRLPQSPLPHLSPKERRLRAHQRQKDLNRLSRRLVLLINLLTLLSLLLWCARSLFLLYLYHHHDHPLLSESSSSSFLYSNSEFELESFLLFSESSSSTSSFIFSSFSLFESFPWLARLLGASCPPEALLAACCLCGLLYICDASFRRLGNLGLARASHSYKLKRHNLLALGLSASALLYFSLVPLLLLCALLPPGASLLLLRAVELLHCGLVLRLLGSPSLSLKAPFPSETKAITQDWLTSVLHENGHLRRGINVTAFWTEGLKGGCHFKVSRVNLRYSKEKHDGPKTVVVKLLSWNKPVLERALLHVKCVLDIRDDREVMYLKSYQMEHLFYKRQVYAAEQGLKIPQVFFNLEDVFNNRFGMVCQDLSALDDGQPHGFPLLDCETFLQHLAQFHASHWGDGPGLAFTGWDEAGYWTGNKREATKNRVAEAWHACWTNFPALGLRARFPLLGQQLLARLDYVRAEFDKAEAPPYRTLCHGDFKISNLFIGNLASALLRQASAGFATFQQSSYSDFSGVRHGDGSTTEVSDDPDTPGQDPVDFESRDVYAIDWQWFGLGNCAIDVASFLLTTPTAQTLPKIDQLLETYHRALLQHLPAQYAYPFPLFRHHFDVAVVDFCTYCITAKWSAMTPEDFENNARKVHDGLHLRSFPHMGVIIHRATHILEEWNTKLPNF